MAKKIGKDQAKKGRSIQFQFADKTAERYIGSQLTRAGKFYDENRFEEALQVLEPLPTRYPNQPRLFEQLGLTYARLGRLTEAREALEEAFRLTPGTSGLLAQFNLAQVYALTGYTFLAYEQSQKIDCLALARETGQPATLERCRQFTEDARRLVEKVAAQYGRSLSEFEEFGLALDNGRSALERQELTTAQSFFLRAGQLEPTVAAPYNNLALVYLLDNRLDLARQQAEYVLEQLETDNRNALSLLIRLSVIEGDPAQAEQYLQRLTALPESDDPDDLLKLGEALAALERDQALLDLLRPLLSSDIELNELDSAAYQEVLTFGVVAAANLGQVGVAMQILRNANKFVRPTLLERTLFALENNERGPRPGGRFFYYDPLTAYPPAAAYFQGVLVRLDDKTSLDYRESLRTFFEQYGESALEVAAYKYWIDRDPQLVADLLDQLIESGVAGGEEMVRRLAFSRAGDDLQRLTAADVLTRQDRLDPTQPLKLWLGQRQVVGTLDQLRRLYNETTARQPTAPQYDATTATDLNAALDAMRRGDRDRAIELYRGVIARNPQVKQAYQNLAALLSGKGELEPAIAYLKEALALDPDYRHAQIALAQLEIGSAQLEAAQTLLDELQPKMEASAYLDELEAFYAALISLYQKQDQPDKIKPILERLLQVDPDNAWATELLASTSSKEATD